MASILETKLITKKDVNGKMKVWVIGKPFSGKSLFADSFPDALFASTDGNFKECKSPAIMIRDEVAVSGRLTNVTFAWMVFKDLVDELAKKQNQFQTVVVDLVDDIYESCRVYMYHTLGISHESDDNYRAWDKVRTEFLSTMRKLISLDYNIVLISHAVDVEDLTSRSGDKVVGANPNIQKKVANKLSGMVDMTVYATVEKGEYLLILKPRDGYFGGVRGYNVPERIPTNFEEFEKMYKNTRSE